MALYNGDYQGIRLAFTPCIRCVIFTRWLYMVSVGT